MNPCRAPGAITAGNAISSEPPNARGRTKSKTRAVKSGNQRKDQNPSSVRTFHETLVEESIDDERRSDSVVLETELDVGDEEEDEELMFSRIDEKLSGAISPALHSSTPSVAGPSSLSSTPAAFHCPNCSESHCKSSDLIHHMTTAHGYNGQQLINAVVKLDKELIDKATITTEGSDKRRLFKCPECETVVRSVKALTFHVLIHKDEKYYRCELCPKSFRLPSNLTRHLREFHLRERRFSCPECGNGFANADNLRQHMNIHTGHRPYACTLCGKTFKQKSSLYVHKRCHEVAHKHHCQVCGAGFRTRLVLEQHTRVHTKERPFECPTCQRRFRVKQDMVLHQSVHSDVKPFQCGTCALQFRQRRYLLRHTKKHHHS